MFLSNQSEAVFVRGVSHPLPFLRIRGQRSSGLKIPFRNPLLQLTVTKFNLIYMKLSKDINSETQSIRLELLLWKGTYRKQHVISLFTYHIYIYSLVIGVWKRSYTQGSCRVRCSINSTFICITFSLQISGTFLSFKNINPTCKALVGDCE